MPTAPVHTTNDGTGAEPYLRSDLNLGTMLQLPDWSTAPRGDHRRILEGIRDAGYRGVQHGDPATCRELGLGCSTSSFIGRPGEIAAKAAAWRAAGFECATLNVGRGQESDAEIDALVRDIVAAARDEGFPLFIETHRGQMTQDTWRTVRMVERHPDVRFNADFSHWYTGLELKGGDWEARLAFLAPVLERVRFFHGRCGNSCHIQVPLADPTMVLAMGHFRELWTRAMAGFLRTASPGDFICFAPELLPAGNNYARLIPGPDGVLREESDRWQEALALSQVARECFAEARRRCAAAAAAD